VTQFTISSAVELLRLVTSDDIVEVIVEKLINIDQNLRCSVSKLSTEFVSSHCELDSCVASATAMCILGIRCNATLLLLQVVTITASAQQSTGLEKFKYLGPICYNHEL